MKKVWFFVWLNILVIPVLLTFTLDENGCTTIFNWIGGAWMVILAVFGKYMMPKYMFRYLKALVRKN